jgi:hypothetical protein
MYLYNTSGNLSETKVVTSYIVTNGDQCYKREIEGACIFTTIHDLLQWFNGTKKEELEAMLDSTDLVIRKVKVIEELNEGD